MEIREYKYLAEDAKMIRSEVFIKEQGFKNEFDEVDERAIHIVMYDNDIPVAVCRIYTEDVGEYIFGRLAVRKAYRGKNIGTDILIAAEKSIYNLGGTSIKLHAQCRVQPFYEKLGYRSTGVIDDDEGCPHVWMKKDIDNIDILD